MIDILDSLYDARLYRFKYVCQFIGKSIVQFLNYLQTRFEKCNGSLGFALTEPRMSKRDVARLRPSRHDACSQYMTSRTVLANYIAVSRNTLY
jgi:hypothetical protein